ncbi:MAG: exodeoxyribonuclease V subunit alpha [Dokdonella sp.]
MMRYSFTRGTDEVAADAWRPLDRALAHWVRAHGGSSDLASVAAWASVADGMGDSALPLLGDAAGRHGMPLLTPAAVDALRAGALVGDGESPHPTPFVLDAGGRFALWRNHAHEVRIAEQIRARRAVAHPVAAAALVDDLDTLFHGDRTTAVQRQRDAVAAVVGRRLFVLTGGPGTGKTTTVLRMLLMLRRHRSGPLTIQVAAPTGKAAQRLLQSLREGKKKLQAADGALLPVEWQPLLACIPDSDALTVHRLLGFDPRRNVFTRGAAYPLAADIVVIDEASMIDLGMLRALLDALRSDATLILVGDADQLTSVAAGSVLMDVVGALESQHAPELVRLEHSFRAEQYLVSINEAVRSGQADAFASAFAAAGKHARAENVDNLAQLHTQLDRWGSELADLPIRPMLAACMDTAQGSERECIEQHNSDAAIAALRALARQQLLCALREDSFGALAVNRAIEQRLRRHWNIAPEQRWYPGRAIMITRNDYSARLFNGDVGVVLGDASGTLRVWFQTTLPDGRVAARGLATGTLPPHDGAFAVTIHKSQGSEYERAAVLLPPDAGHRILSRQLLYTGLSRAKSDVELWATDASIAAALSHPVLRVGGLATRLLSSTAP